MASRLVLGVSATICVALTACAPSLDAPAEVRPNEAVSLGDVTFAAPQNDLYQSLVLASEREPVIVGEIVKLGEVDMASVVNDDGTKSEFVSTRFVVDIVTVIQGSAPVDDVIEIVVPGGVSQNVTYSIHGIPSAEQIEVGERAVFVLSPIVENLYPVNAIYPVRRDGAIESLEGEEQLQSEDSLASLSHEAGRERQNRIAARPHDDEFAGRVEGVCGTHSASLLKAKDTLTQLAADPKNQQLLLDAVARLEATKSFGAELAAMRPTSSTSSATQSGWDAVVAAIDESGAAIELLSSESESDVQGAIVEVATAASALESALQRVGAGACAGFGP